METTYSPSKAIQVEEAEMFIQGSYVGNGGAGESQDIEIGFEPDSVEIWKVFDPETYPAYHTMSTKTSHTPSHDTELYYNSVADKPFFTVSVLAFLDYVAGQNIIRVKNDPITSPSLRNLNDNGVTYYYRAWKA